MQRQGQGLVYGCLLQRLSRVCQVGCDGSRQGGLSQSPSDSVSCTVLVGDVLAWTPAATASATTVLQSVAGKGSRSDGVGGRAGGVRRPVSSHSWYVSGTLGLYSSWPRASYCCGWTRSWVCDACPVEGCCGQG